MEAARHVGDTVGQAELYASLPQTLYNLKPGRGGKAFPTPPVKA